jgi:hypothetical protein
MGTAHGRPALAGFRDTVRELTAEGLPLGDVEDAINAQPALTADQKSALWLFAFCLCDRSAKQSQARPKLPRAGGPAAQSRVTRAALALRALPF